MRTFLWLLLILCWITNHAVFCLASGPMKVTFDQANDCAVITGWQVEFESTVTAGAVPGSKSIGVSIPNTAPLVCGSGILQTIPVSTVGLTRFWVQAVAAGGITSAFSNSIDVAVPFLPPHLVSVGS